MYQLQAIRGLHVLMTSLKSKQAFLLIYNYLLLVHVCLSHRFFGQAIALDLIFSQRYIIKTSKVEKWAKEEDECAFIVGMAKGGATISKIVEETKRPSGTVATILRKYRLRGNIFQTVKRSGRPPNTTSTTYDNGVACLMMELVHWPLLMAVSLVQSTVAFCRNISYYQLQKDNAGAKPLFCKMTTHQSIEPAQ